MKRLFIMIICASLLLMGCQQSELALKDKCSKFVEIAQKRWKEIDYKGTFYSKEKKTCVSIYYFDSAMDFYNEFNGTYFGPFSPEKGFSFEQSLNLLK